MCLLVGFDDALCDGVADLVEHVTVVGAADEELILGTKTQTNTMNTKESG